MLSLLSQCRCVFVFFIFHAGYLTKVCVYVRAHTHTRYSMLVATVTKTPTSLRHCFRQPSHKKKELLFLPFIPSSTLLPVHLLLKNGTHWSALIQHNPCLCVCVYLTYVCTLHVCTLPWLQAGLTGVITSKPPSQQAKRERNGLKVNTHTH